jgi:hypothetical protein
MDTGFTFQPPADEQALHDGEEVERSLWRAAGNVRGHVVPDCARWIPKEQPRLLADHLLRFFAGS